MTELFDTAKDGNLEHVVRLVEQGAETTRLLSSVVQRTVVRMSLGTLWRKVLIWREPVVAAILPSRMPLGEAT